MAIPGDPAVQDIILQGMKEGGQYVVTAGGTAFAEFKSYQFETIKSEMWAACKTDRLLETETVLIASVGKSALTLPSDFDSEIKLVIYDADDGFRGTAQAGATATVTLAADFSSTPETLYGRYIFTLTGTGAAQVRQIIDYNDTTKVVTVHADWTTQPDNTTTYLVATAEYELRRSDYQRFVRDADRPSIYGRTGITLNVSPAPDKLYPIIMLYRVNLTRLDDAGSLFVKHMRERRNLWVQGVKTKTMLRYDDDRYSFEKSLWDQALLQYAAENVVYDQLEPYR